MRNVHTLLLFSLLYLRNSMQEGERANYTVIVSSNCMSLKNKAFRRKTFSKSWITSEFRTITYQLNLKNLQRPLDKYVLNNQ